MGEWSISLLVIDVISLLDVVLVKNQFLMIQELKSNELIASK